MAARTVHTTGPDETESLGRELASTLVDGDLVLTIAGYHAGLGSLAKLGDFRTVESNVISFL